MKTPDGKLETKSLETLNVTYIRVIEEPKPKISLNPFKAKPVEPKLISFVKNNVAYLTESDYALYLELQKGNPE